MPSMPTRRKLLMTAAILLLASSGPGQTAGLRDVSPESAYQVLQSGAPVTILDIRTPWEFSAGHIEGAVNIDFYEKSFADRIMALEPGGTYLIYCQTGVRSRALMNALAQTSFQDVMHIPAGFSGWQRMGLPFVR